MSPEKTPAEMSTYNLELPIDAEEGDHAVGKAYIENSARSYTSSLSKDPGNVNLQKKAEYFKNLSLHPEEWGAFYADEAVARIEQAILCQQDNRVGGAEFWSRTAMDWAAMALLLESEPNSDSDNKEI